MKKRERWMDRKKACCMLERKREKEENVNKRRENGERY